MKGFTGQLSAKRGFSWWRDLRSSTGASKRQNYSSNLCRALHWL